MKESEMSQLKDQLRLMIPRLAADANQFKDPEGRSRWMKIRAIALSTKSVLKACAAQGCSVDFFNKWGKRLLKRRSLLGLLTKSRKPYRSPGKSKPRIEKAVLKLRRVEPYLGPNRVSDALEDLYDINVTPSTVYRILKRAEIVGRKIQQRLTKKHMKRYRRPFPGYLQMDFKYVPYKIDGRQYYQLSCVDHHSSWRFIRCYRNKNLACVMNFLNEIKEACPFHIMEIQTDNDTAFTDKFSSGLGVTGEHQMDVWCNKYDIVHRLIPVGVKELNGKVENTHKQDDREFFALGKFNTFESLDLNSRGYNERWNSQRATRALGRKTPNQAILDAIVKALALHRWIRNMNNQGLHQFDENGDTFLPIQKPKKSRTEKTRTTKKSAAQKYLDYLEWAEKKKLPAIFFTYPTMSRSFSPGPMSGAKFDF